LRLGDAVADRLAHLARHQAGVIVRLGAKDCRGLAHRSGAIGDRSLAPIEKGVVDLADDLVHRVGRGLIVRFENFAGCRVDRLDRHVWNSERQLRW